jgi:uncharacterized cupin superfamily protein
MPPIKNIADAEFITQKHGERFEARLAQLGPQIGASQLGCRVVIVPPGKCAWPYHNHHVNEEMFVILEGTGTLRLGGKKHPLRAGDVVSCPAGGAETAHQIVNTGTSDLRYLAISTMQQPEVAEYPDSAKFVVMSGSAPGGDITKRRMWYVGRPDTGLDYWDGE